MRYQKIDGKTHIYVEAGETDQQVLRAIVKASYELARPAGLGWLHFDPQNLEMTDEEADQCINLKPGQYDPSIRMDYIDGRQCKTFIDKVEDGHFVLANSAYERDRGVPDPMLNRAKDILAGKKEAGLASTSYMYQGENLTLRLKEYGYARNNGEGDWNFRKRVFPDLFEKDATRALEFLLGASAAEWEEMDKILVAFLLESGKPSRAELVKFAVGFAEDPIIHRERVKSAPTN